jgi:hypothetical protein
MGGLEGLISSTVLVHLDCEVKPGFRVCIRRSSRCHSHKSSRYPLVKPSTEFHHNGFGVGIPGVIHQVMELVQVIVNCPFALEIGQSLQYIYGCGFRIEGHEIFAELILEVDPVEEAEPPISESGLVLELSGGPVTGPSRLHVGHSPDDFDAVIIKGLWAQADVSPARSQEL